MATLQAATTRRRVPGPGSSAGSVDRKRMLAGIPVAERRLELGGVSTAVLEGGTGPPLLLLHGGIESGGAYWALVASHLAATHRLVIPDLPGLGESEPVARLDDAAFGEWLAALLQLTCDRKPVLVAHSLAGGLAARFAAEQGDLLQRLVIYGTPGLGRYRMPPGLMLAAVRFDLRPTQRNQERFERWAFLDSDRTKRQDREWFDAFDAYSVSCGRVRHVKRAMRQLIRAETKRTPEAVLLRIGTPASLLWGRHDRMVPLRLAETASASLGWPLRVIDGAGHAPHLEQPGAFVAALRAVLGGS